MSGPASAGGPLAVLAEAAGLQTRWRDVRGVEQEVSTETLRALLAALGRPADTPARAAESLARLREEEGAGLPPLCTALLGRPVLLGLPGEPRWRLSLEGGGVRKGASRREEGLLVLPAVEEAGYHALEVGGHRTTLAVCPPRCHGIAPGDRPWGLAVQLYGPRRRGDGGVGDFAALAGLACSAARRGADALAISPVHAQFSADPSRFSPYAPSSRLFLNVLHAPLDALGEAPLREALAATGLAEEASRLESLDLVDWPAAARARLAVWRAVFEARGEDEATRRFRELGGEALESHARFEAIHARLLARDPGLWHWRGWPEALRRPDLPGVEAFARENAREVAFHAFLQWVADRSLGEAARAFREAGAGIGLIADLAVGTDSGGSHVWSRGREILRGVSVGAPPDLFSPLGQDWGITAFSPRGLREGGYAAFLEMLRSALRHAGGVRVDHAMGLARLWLVPEGAGPAEGAYLRFPAQDLLRLVALESVRHRALVLGEDLGTLPEGFRGATEAAGLMGLRVLWFERGPDGAFTPPDRWSPGAVAVTTTHDLPTVAGWWGARDVDWRARLGLLGEGADGAAERAEREADRARLWAAMRAGGAASGEPPPPGAPGAVVEAACRHVGSAACALALLPLEDALAEAEAPNLPGTTDAHPNWRRRPPGEAATLLDAPEVAARLAALAEARRR